MAKTAVADIIVPLEFEKYAIERTAELSAFGQCGIIESAPEFDARRREQLPLENVRADEGIVFRSLFLTAPTSYQGRRTA